MVRGDLLRKAVISEAVHVKDEELPAGWRWVRLGDIADLRHGVNFRKHEINTQATKDVRILRGGNVLDDKLVIFKDDLFLPSANVKAVDYLQEQDIITPSVTSLVNVGKVAFIDYPIESTACGAFMYRVRAKSDEVLPKYLYFAMSSNFVKYQMKRMTHKSVVAFYNVTMKNFRTVLIPLPPIDEQRRIVAYLDPLVRELTELEDHLTKFRAARERFRKAAIQDATHTREGEELPAGWRWVRLEDVVSLRSGVDLTKREHNNKGEGIPYIIGASNFEDGEITITRWTTTPKTIAHRGEILFTCKGTVGEVAILQEEQAHIARQVWAVIPHDADTKYIVYVLLAKAQYLKSKAWTFIPGIRMKVLRDMVIPLPPRDEQLHIVSYLDNLSHQIDIMDL